MPIYNFEHLETKEVWEETMPYDDMEAYEKEHNCRLIFLQGPQVIGTSKDIWSEANKDAGFKHRMEQIKKTAAGIDNNLF